jgi:DNA-binding transcriptional ArsR family regulator
MHHPAEPEVDERLLRALGDPTRQRVVTMLNERVATAPEIARELDITENEVASHLAVLVANDAVEASSREAASDSTWYRATIRPFLDDAHWAQLTHEERRALVEQNIRQIFDHVAPALAAGGFDDERAHVSLTRLDLDARGWDEVADLLAGVLEEIMDIHAESVDRVTRGESTTIVAAELAVMHFQRAARAARARPERVSGHRPA